MIYQACSKQWHNSCSGQEIILETHSRTEWVKCAAGREHEPSDVWKPLRRRHASARCLLRLLAVVSVSLGINVPAAGRGHVEACAALWASVFNSDWLSATDPVAASSISALIDWLIKWLELQSQSAFCLPWPVITACFGVCCPERVKERRPMKRRAAFTKTAASRVSPQETRRPPESSLIL